MTALTEAPWHEFKLGHVKVGVHPDVFTVNPATDRDCLQAIIVMIGAAIRLIGLRLPNVHLALLRRPTVDERLCLLELVQRDREAEGYEAITDGSQVPEGGPLAYDFVLELEYRPKPKHHRPGQKAGRQPSEPETTFFGIIWPDKPGQPMIWILPTEPAEENT